MQQFFSSFIPRALNSEVRSINYSNIKCFLSLLSNMTDEIPTKKRKKKITFGRKEIKTTN